MISWTAVFLCLYHLALSVLGSLFFENYLFKDFDNSFSLVKIIFCFSFVLCLSLLSMIVFEILGFITTSLKLFIWYIDITLLILFIYLIIPVSLIYTYITFEDEKTANSLFKFKYFYTALTKMKHKKKKIYLPDEDKTNFMRKLVYVSEDLILKMKNYNKKIRNRNKQKILKFVVGCIFFLPIIWFTFYKISMITLKNNSDVYDKSDIYDIGNILQEKFKLINKEFAEEYDTNNENSQNFLFIKIIKNLLIYISVTGMTIVSAFSAFTSLYSPYTNISNFFFFVTLKKVKIIEKKIMFITDELASKKKMLLLHDYPHLINLYSKNVHYNESCFSNKLHSYNNRNRHNNYTKNLHFDKTSSFYNTSANTNNYSFAQNVCLNGCENFTDNTFNYTNNNDTINRYVDNSPHNCYGILTYHIDDNFNVETMHSHNDHVNHCGRENKHGLKHTGGHKREEAEGVVMPMARIEPLNGNGNVNVGIRDSGKEQIKSRENKQRKQNEEIEYIHFKPFKKCNLYLGSHKSIYKNIYETFIKKEKNFGGIFNLNGGYDEVEGVVVEEKKEMEMLEKKMDMLEKKQKINVLNLTSPHEECKETHVENHHMSILNNNRREVEVDISTRSSSSNRFSPFVEYINSTNSLYKRNVKSTNLMENNNNNDNCININDNSTNNNINNNINNNNINNNNNNNKYVDYKKKFIFFKTTEKEEEREAYDVEHNEETKEISSCNDGEEKNKSIFHKYNNTVHSFKNLFRHFDTLPQDIKHKESKSINRRYISAFLFNSFQKPYKTFQSVKEFFTGKKANVNKKNKEILIQDIKALEYMAKNLYFLLDEVIKEQIRINQSTTFCGIFLYLLGIIMSILCIYKIVKTCYIIYMIEIYYRFISTYSSGHVLMLFYSRNMNISFINDLKNVLHIVHININLDNYVISITSILLLCFIFTNLKTFMEKIIKLRYSTKSSLYSNIAILVMCEIMDLYFSAYCIQLFDYLPVKEKVKMLYIFFNNNLLNLFKLKYHFDFVYVISLFISLALIKLHHKHRSDQFREI
ncbi:conserved Plasmodium protein, unknown function [Plasmodium malariae]|uniref:Protein GPR89 n=3 Tax=Plasmodium malariae TaxID=5858 RepID=A0A1D3TCZ3_PLAMA|nr:conserved Plasmodium protein, unknown function [Plasmodium malariae]SCP02737.1 conserved Plasmodium protein, unknown function [Plasmodium malariae]